MNAGSLCVLLNVIIVFVLLSLIQQKPLILELRSKFGTLWSKLDLDYILRLCD